MFYETPACHFLTDCMRWENMPTEMTVPQIHGNRSLWSPSSFFFTNFFFPNKLTIGTPTCSSTDNDIRSNRQKQMRDWELLSVPTFPLYVKKNKLLPCQPLFSLVAKPIILPNYDNLHEVSAWNVNSENCALDYSWASPAAAAVERKGVCTVGLNKRC